MRRLRRGRFFGHARLRREVGDLVLVESHHAAGSRLPRHSHEHAYFCLNIGGTYLESYGRRRRRCCTGMLVFHPPGGCHEEDHHSDVSSLNVELDGTWLRRVAELVAPLEAETEASSDVTADAPQEAGTDSGSDACNDLSNIGTIIQQTYVATAAVTGNGGPIVDGTYVLTAAVVYTGADGGSGPTGTTLRDTLTIDTASLYQRVLSVINDAGLDGSPGSTLP